MGAIRVSRLVFIWVFVGWCLNRRCVKLGGGRGGNAEEILMSNEYLRASDYSVKIEASYVASEG